MGNLLAYALTSSLVLSLLYLTYKWVLSSENYHRVNRLIIWSIYIVSLCFIPLWQYVSGMSGTASHSMPVIDMEGLTVVGTIAADPANSFDWLQWLVRIYAAGLICVILLTITNFFRLVGIIRKGNMISVGSRKIILTEDPSLAPFSFGNTIVIPHKDFQQYGKMILLHEKSHVELRHWVDLLFAQVVCVLQWFNPAAWLMREELKTVHEYQADANVIASGTDIKDYQMLLIKKAVGARFPSLANSLNHSKLKKRITMMYNQKSSRRRILRPLLLLPAIGAALWISQLPAVASALSSVASVGMGDTSFEDKVSDNPADVQVSVVDVPESSVRVLSITKNEGSSSNSTTMTVPATDDTSEPLKVVEEMPHFPGGEKAMMKYVIENFKYPEGTEGVKGRVIVNFVVEKDGSIGDVKVIRSVDPRIDEEAVRVVKSFPKWTPGKVDGKPVSVHYMLPVNLRPESSEDKTASKPVSISTSSSTVTTSSGDSPTRTITFTTVGSDTGDSSYSYNVLVTSDGDTDFSKIPVYVDGKRLEGDLNSISPSDIESMTVDKSQETGPAIRITLKKK